MFPIRTPAGRLVGFGGRTLGDETAKYINGYYISKEVYPINVKEAVIGVLNGGLIAGNDEIVGPGDVGSLASFKRLAKSFRVINGTEMMVICDPKP